MNKLVIAILLTATAVSADGIYGETQENQLEIQREYQEQQDRLQRQLDAEAARNEAWAREQETQRRLNDIEDELED